MTSSSTMVQPKYLAAAALAYAVVSNSKKDLHKVPARVSTSDDDDSLDLDAIPEIEGDVPTVKKRVVPVVIKAPVVAHHRTTAPTTTTPKQAKVSAGTILQLESRRRVRSAMEKYQHPHKKEAHVTGRTSITTASVPASPVSATPKKTIAKATIRTPPPADTPVTTASSPPSVVSCAPVRFKVKSTTSGTVLRFQCVPTYINLLSNISERLRRNSKTSSLWSTATNLITSSDSGLTIEFQDAESDWCTLTNDEDLQDAVEASLGRKDDMVRLNIEEHDTAKRVWNSLSTSFGW
uniref:PB1 domain-containing protein n=1 Tax=Amphora coffeiformis TaxID=265554 RepID=A0A7S3LA18_9STRA|eukprot:scaffold6506_cov171-Amphora_coffeaeformis.AAC.15